MENFSLAQLKNLGIYDLRTIARGIGVKSPTTKRHDELVDSILKIQKGEEVANITKKGRPPKRITLDNTIYDFEKAEGQSLDFIYVEDKADAVLICDGDNVDSLNKKYYICTGIFREVDGQKYIYSHLNSIHFTKISDDLIKKHNLRMGDYVTGSAFELNNKIGMLESIDDINFSKIETFNGSNCKKFEIKQLTEIGAIYNTIKQQNDKNIKIVLELEVDDYSIVNLKDDCIYFYSRELDDIKRSFNALLDCLMLVQNLCKGNKPFSLYLIDIDYIYNILTVYTKTLKPMGYVEDVNAGQFIKTILSSVKNSVGGNAVIYENRKYKRNEYLDAILNKYIW